MVSRFRSKILKFRFPNPVLFFLLPKDHSPINFRECWFNPLVPNFCSYIYFFFQVCSSLGFKKKKTIFFFSPRTVFLGEQKACPIPFVAVQNPHWMPFITDLGFLSCLHLSNHCFVAYLPNIFQICLCTKPSNIVTFWIEYTFDFVLVSLQMHF